MNKNHVKYCAELINNFFHLFKVQNEKLKHSYKYIKNISNAQNIFRYNYTKKFFFFLKEFFILNLA